MSTPASGSMLYYAGWKKWLTLLLCLLAVLYTAPNFLPKETVQPYAEKYSRWLPFHQINLGLDLQGGSYLLLKVDLDVAMRDRLNGLMDAVRSDLQDRRIGYIGLSVVDNGVAFTLRDAAQRDQMSAVRRKVDPEMEVGDEDGKVVFTLPPASVTRYHQQLIDQSIEIVRKRVDESGTREPLIQRSGEDRILLQLPGVSDPQQIKRLLGQTAKMTFHLVDENATSSGGLSVPPGYVSLPGHNPTDQRHYVIKREPALSGETLTDAQTSINPTTGQPAVSFRFDSLGARKFGDITKANVNQMFAIVLDGKVITAPVIREPILGGQGQIDGSFTVQEANELSLLLRAGALPAPLTVLEERTVGPGLGSDSIDAGKICGIAGFLLVVVWMIVSYGRFGWYADVALTLNLCMIFGLFNIMGVTLTLPGIAAIILTIGMAVDANVLIYERIREEIRLGRSPLSSVDSGYSRAMASITDANLTTLIAGLILFMLGSGPVKGFAVALTVGIVTSVFSSIMVTRLMVLRYLRVARPATLHI